MPLPGRSFATALSLAARAFVPAALLAPLSAFAGIVDLSGHVTSHLTGEPLAGARIAISISSSPFNTIEIGSALSDANGFYEWNGDCETLYGCFVTADDPPYLPGENSFDASESVVLMDFALIAPATVSGTLRFPGGDPGDLYVAAQQFLDDVGLWIDISTAHLDGDGHFVIGALPPATYRFCTSYTQDGAIRQCFDHVDMPPTAIEPDATLVDVAEGSTQVGIDFDLVQGGTLSGQIRDGYLGAPLLNTPAEVTAYDVDGNWLLAGTSDAAGVFHLRGLPDGSFYLGINIGGPYADGIQFYPGIACTLDSCPPPTSGTLLTITNGGEIADLDFTVHPDVVVKGRVFDAGTGAGLGGVEVGLYDFGGSGRTLSTADSGNYMFYAYADKPMEIGAFHAPPRIDSVYPAASCIYGHCIGDVTPVSGSTGSVLSGIDIPMALGAVLSGRVLRTDGVQQGDADIALFDAGFTLIWQGSSDAGSYATDPWLPGTYYVEALAFSSLEGCAFYDDRPCPENGGDPAGVDPTPINVVAGETRTGIDFHFSAVDEIYADGFDF